MMMMVVVVIIYYYSSQSAVVQPKTFLSCDVMCCRVLCYNFIVSCYVVSLRIVWYRVVFVSCYRLRGGRGGEGGNGGAYTQTLRYAGQDSARRPGRKGGRAVKGGGCRGEGGTAQFLHVARRFRYQTLEGGGGDEAEDSKHRCVGVSVGGRWKRRKISDKDGR